MIVIGQSHDDHMKVMWLLCDYHVILEHMPTFKWLNLIRIVGLILVSLWISDAGMKMKWICKPRASSSKHENACKYCAICYAYSFSIFMNMNTLMNMVKRILIHLKIQDQSFWPRNLGHKFGYCCFWHSSMCQNPPKNGLTFNSFSRWAKILSSTYCASQHNPYVRLKKGQGKVKIVPAQLVCGAKKRPNLSRHKSYVGPKWGLVMHSVLISDVAVK